MFFRFFPYFNSTPTAPHASNASSKSNVKALGSLTTSAESAEDDGKPKGKLSSLIYGTKEGREMDKDIEHSFSQVLARGKYVHSIVFHQVKPDKVDEYVELVGKWYPRMASLPENKVHLVGSWRTEVGDCDTFGKLTRPLLGHEGSVNTAQFTSGNIKDTTVITTPCTQSPITPNFQHSTRSSKLL